MYNTLLIKRRLANSPLNDVPILSGGELAYNEKTNELYYGSSLGTITIAGSGGFVDRVSEQTIGGNKTFTGQTTLSSTTFSTNSVINAGNNVITNVANPIESGDAVNRGWLISNFVDLTGTDQTINGKKTFNDAVLIDDDLTVTGNLSVLGTSTQVDTLIAVTSALSITNAGTGPALTVTQEGANDVATFYDDANVALIIKDGGNVGIGVDTPSERLTVSGNVSASGNIFGVNATLVGTLEVTQGVTFSSNVSGAEGTSQLINFIIDGGTF